MMDPLTPKQARRLERAVKVLEELERELGNGIGLLTPMDAYFRGKAVESVENAKSELDSALIALSVHCDSRLADAILEA